MRNSKIILVRVNQLCNANKCTEGLLLHVYENSVLATLPLDHSGWSSIRFHQITDSIAGKSVGGQTRMSLWKRIWKPKQSFSLKLMNEEKIIYNTSTRTHDWQREESFRDHFTHLEHDKNW